MGSRTNIEWTDATWTPIRARNRATGKVGWHCERVSPGCEHCYSEAVNAQRLGTRLPFKPGHRADVEIFLDEAMLVAPLRWTRPRRIFVCSMTDLFGEFVPDAMIDRVFAVMALCPQHTFQILTKRSARMRAYMGEPDLELRVQGVVDTMEPDGIWRFSAHEPWVASSFPLRNIWLGVSAEDQRRADERVPDLLATPAAVRFVSAEPLLGRLDLRGFIRSRSGMGLRPWSTFEWPTWVPQDTRGQIESFWSERQGRGPCSWMENAVHNGQPTLGTRGRYLLCRAGEHYVEGRFIPAWNNIGRVIDDAGAVHVVNAGRWSGSTYLDQIIVGGESGPDARPMHTAWAQAMRDQCAAAGVPFLFKQWGTYLPEGQSTGAPIGSIDIFKRRWCTAEDGDDRYTPDAVAVHPVGKKRAGRLLDGVEHNGMPGGQP